MMSSLYIGATGMITLGHGLGTVSNNLANMNTVGFKERLQLYEDLMSSAVPTPSSAPGRGGVLPTSYSQQGHGSRPSAVITRFYETGGIEIGDRVTDLCIGGKGFFQVQQGDKTYYTRAGNFYFNKEGELINPNQFNLMGKPITNGVAGGLTPIKLDPLTDMYMKPQATTKATLISALGMTAAKTSDPVDPFFSLAKSYNATSNPPIGSSGFANQISVYDSNGRKHDITVNYDLAEVDSDGRKIVQFVVNMNPSEDGRAGFEGTPGAGLLMSGTLTFTSSGVLQNMSAYKPTDGANANNLSTWSNVSIGADGMAIDAVFKSVDDKGNPVNLNQVFDLDFGLGFASPAGGVPPASIGTNPNNLPGFTDAGNNPPPNVTNKNRTTAYSGDVGTPYRKSNGYAPGHATNVMINNNGVLSVIYDNGQSADKFQIPLYIFRGEQDLKAEGSNMYSPTIGSGEAIEGEANTENFGKIISTALEMSNVDLGRQFTHMILTQRGFQFNSKVVTTSDAMLQKALELKR